MCVCVRSAVDSIFITVFDQAERRKTLLETLMDSPAAPGTWPEPTEASELHLSLCTIDFALLFILSVFFSDSISTAIDTAAPLDTILSAWLASQGFLLEGTGLVRATPALSDRISHHLMGNF